MSLEVVLQNSNATDSFRTAVVSFVNYRTPNDRLSFDRRCPPVKIARTLVKLLEQHPELAIESVDIDGSSGCEFFRGTLTVRTAGDAVQIHFHWDCRWKAEEMGWVDYFGFPDQARAAREFDHDCFREWVVVETLSNACA